MRKCKQASDEQMKSQIINHFNLLLSDTPKSSKYWEILIKTLIRIRYGISKKGKFFLSVKKVNMEKILRMISKKIL